MIGHLKLPHERFDLGRSDVLQELLHVHSPPRRTNPRANTPPRSPPSANRHLTSADAYLPGIEPNRGPPDGGYTIGLRGRNLPETLELLWDFEDTVTAHRVSSSTMELTVPRASDDKTEVAIKIAGAPRIESVFSSFEYDR